MSPVVKSGPVSCLSVAFVVEEANGFIMPSSWGILVAGTLGSGL